MRSRPQTAYRRPVRPRVGRQPGVHWFLLVALLLAAAFIEVWESTTAAQLSLEIDRLQEQVRDTEARVHYLVAQADEASSRVQLAPEARRLGLKPADPEQVVVIPRDYLAAGGPERVPQDGLAAIGQRIEEVFVPQARAQRRGAGEGGS